MRNKQYHTVRTIPKGDIKVVYVYHLTVTLVIEKLILAF